MKVRFKNIKGPDQIWDMYEHLGGEDSSNAEKFMDRYVEDGDYITIDVDPVTFTGALVPLKDW